ncbi:hypothetical protein MHYP_G00184060 [Metynnis hypsauchen]
MDPAELDPIKSALHNQGVVIGRHEQLLHDMMQQLTLLVRAQTEGAQPASASASTGVGAGASAATPVLASPLPPADPTPIWGDALVANPERYAGDPETCRGFLLQCSLVFEQQPSRFPTERSKVAYMISLLTGRVLAWATSLWERDSRDTASVENFMRAMRTTFHNPRGGREAAPHLLALSQGTRSKACASLLTTTEARKQVTDHRRHPAPTFQPGQRVWLSAKDLPLHVESKKLAPRYVGPFKIDWRVNPVSYRLRLPPSMRVHPTFHMSRLRPFLCGTRPPAPCLVAGSPAYTVCCLLDSRRVGVQYLVDWEGYGPEERSWVPASHILDQALIMEFRQARAGGLGTSGAVPRRGCPVRVQPAPSAASRGRWQQGAQAAPPAACRGRQR